MTFAKIISEAGLNPTDYPKASEIVVTVADQKGRELGEDELNFPSTIFSENSNALKYFKNFLKKCEGNSELVFLHIRLIDSALIILDDAGLPSIFYLR